MNTTTESITVLTTPDPVVADAPAFDVDRHRRRLVRALSKRTFCSLATTSPKGRPHNAGVLYQWVDGALWVHLDRPSRKARNLAANPHVAVCVPFRRLPVGPPYTIHFQAEAELVATDDPRVQRLLADGRLKKITANNALDMPDGCFARIVPTGTVHSFGPGVPVLDLARDPINTGGRSVRLVGDAA